MDINRETILNDAKLQQWFDLSEFSAGTEEVYSRYMQQFCECVGKTPCQLITEAITEIKAGKWLTETSTAEHVAKFKRYLKQKNLSPKAQAVAMACVKGFYNTSNIQLTAITGKIKKPLTLRENQNFLTREDVVKLATNAKSLRDKAIILVMVSSGMVRQEIINLRIKDITFEKIGDNSEIGIISVRRQKSQTDYTTFISPEAIIALKNYFSERERNEKLKIKGNNDFVFVTHDNGSKIKTITFTFIFRQLAHQLGYTNGETKSKKYQIKSKSHALRKYFATELENAGFSKHKIDFMLGHTPNGNDLAYFKTDIEALKQLYIKFLPYLTFERVIEVRSLDTEDARLLEELRKENERLKEKLDSKDSETQDLKKRMEKQESELQEIKSALKAVINAAGKK